MIHPDVMMNMTSDGNEVYRLPKGNFRQRIVNIFGSKYDQRLVPVNETTDIVAISGFVGKPEFAKKTRGEQYFFVNEQFIKSPYLNHAIQAAFDELLPKDQFPSYFLKLEIDPAKVDINIHQTKTEIKFEEERAIYAIIRTAVKQALGKFNIAPSIDFEQESSFNIPMLKKGQGVPMPSIEVDTNFNPFESKKEHTQNSISFPFKRDEKPNPNWEKIYQPSTNLEVSTEEAQTKSEPIAEGKKVFQLHSKYILSHIRSGFVVVHQKRAHERVLIDRLSQQLENQKSSSQQLLFPEDIVLNAEDSTLILSLLEELNELGFDMRPFGKNHFIIHGIPAEANGQNGGELIESLLEEFKQNLSELKNSPKENMIRSLAQSMSIGNDKTMSQGEMIHLIDELFACEMPYSLPNGKPIVINYSLEDLEKQFNKR